MIEAGEMGNLRGKGGSWNVCDPGWRKISPAGDDSDLLAPSDRRSEN